MYNNDWGEIIQRVLIGRDTGVVLSAIPWHETSQPEPRIGESNLYHYRVTEGSI